MEVALYFMFAERIVSRGHTDEQDGCVELIKVGVSAQPAVRATAVSSYYGVRVFDVICFWVHDRTTALQEERIIHDELYYAGVAGLIPGGGREFFVDTPRVRDYLRRRRDQLKKNYRLDLILREKTQTATGLWGYNVE